jgi:hypothetical protein
MLALALWFVSSIAAAAMLQDWSKVEESKNAGTFADKKGSKFKIAQVAGPQEDENALQINSSVVEWGGVWTAVSADLSKTGGIMFSAKASVPMALEVQFMDDRKVQYLASVRVLSTDWEEFVIPMSRFHKTPYPMEEAPKNAAIRWNKIEGMQFNPRKLGSSILSIGPISTVSGKVAAKTGKAGDEDGALTVQDFALLEKNAYGLWDDKKSKISLTNARMDVENENRWVGNFHYDLKPFGWCGAWMRAGDYWGGQDWSGAKKLVMKIYSEDPIILQFGFNDPNQNAYVANFPSTRGTGWETISIPFSLIQLNPYYQPEDAQKGASLDLSHIETINLAPQSQGVHDFKIGAILLYK